MPREDTHTHEQPGLGARGRRRASQPACRASIDADKERDRSLPTPRRYRAGFITRSSVQHILQCNSPSSVSTTSLAQLREKLTILSPLNFTKVPTKIAATPELPVLTEQDEYDRLSNSLYRPRCGVSLRKHYHSDTEAQTVTKQTRHLTPVVEEPSASLGLVAALGPTDQSILNETFDQLYRNNSKFDLADLLVEEALKHGQDKDSGIISGKVTHDSDIVEDTPVEEPARRKKLGLKRRPKDILENKFTTDESDVVDDTPCYDYVWRKRGASVSNKVSKNDCDDIETLNAEAVDAFFSQQTNVNYVAVISPATARKINESSSDDSLIPDDKEIVEKEVSDINLVIEADIVDCVNYVIDKVCNDLDICVDLLAEQQQQIDILKVAENIDNRSNDTYNTLKTKTKDIPMSVKDTSIDKDTIAAKTVTLKFKPKKQNRRMNTTRGKKTKPVKHPNNIEEVSVLKDNTNTKSPTKELIRKKRKLYSPKDDDNENNEILKSRGERRPSTSTESPMAACYKELENARKSRIRLPRKRASTQPVISPKTKKLNDIFDSIKDNVVNDEKITLVPKKYDKDISLYNLSSESDDETFKKKKIQVQKRISSSSLESRSKRRKSVKPVNYNPYFTSDDEYERVLKPKKGKQTKPRSRKTPKINLIDERMRKPQHEVLETSFVEEKIETYIPEEPEPALQQVPVLEIIPPNDLHDELVVSESKNKMPSKSEIIKIKTEKNLRKKCEKLTKSTVRKKKQENIENVPTERDSAAVSPLPGLVVETVPSKDDLTSSVEANLLQKLKKIYTEAEDLSDTQNLLLNADNNNNGGIETVVLSDTGDNQHLLINLENYNENTGAPTENLQAVDLSNGSEKSIETVGRSPITGHNNLDESPPNIDALNESFQHRDVDVEGMSKSMAEFLDNMRNQLRNRKAAANSTSPIIPITRMSTKDSAQSNLCVKNVTSDESNQKPIGTPKSDVRSYKSAPKIILERMSSEEIESHLNPVTPKSKASVCSVILSRISSEEIKKIVTPTRTKKSSTTGSPLVLIDRISSDEINRWLPMPGTIEVVDEEVKKYDTRKTKPKSINTRKTGSRPKSVTCNTCENIKTKISPVKLSFDVVDLTTGFIVERSAKTRSSKNSIRSRSKIEKIRTESVKSPTAKTEKGDAEGIKSQETVIKTIMSENSKSAAKAEKRDVGIKGSQKTVIKSSAETADRSKKEKTVGSTVDPSDMSKSVASVNDWLKRNAAAGSSPSDDTAARKEMLYQEVMEALETRLVEIHESTREAMTAAFLKDQEEVEQLVEEFHKQIERLKKNKIERACDIIRKEADKKARMVQLLKEDIQRLLNKTDF